MATTMAVIEHDQSKDVLVAVMVAVMEAAKKRAKMWRNRARRLRCRPAENFDFDSQ